MNRRRWIAITVAAAAAVAAVVALTTGVTKSVASTGVDVPGSGTAYAAVQTVVPADPVALMTTPPTGEWWDLLVQMFPGASLTEVDPSDSDVTINGYAYSLNRTKSGLANALVPTFPALYVQVTTVEDADKLLAWLAGQPGAETRSTYRSGTTVIILPMWVDPAEEFNLDVKSSTKALAGSVGKPVDVAVWTYNLGRHNDLIAGASEKQGDAYKDFMAAMGFTPDSTFTVTATSPKGKWQGTSKGYNPSEVDLGAAMTILEENADILYEEKHEDGSYAQIRGAGMDQLLHTNTFMAWKDGKPVGGVGIQDENTRFLAPDNDKTVLSGKLNPTQLESSARDLSVERTGPVGIEFAIGSDGNVVLKPDFAEDPAGDPAATGAPEGSHGPGDAYLPPPPPPSAPAP